jgi:uncharacterized protein (DUF1015 family)
MDDIVAPPYDVIDADARDALYHASPYNVTRLILNPEGHDVAAELFGAWQRDGILQTDERPTFYLYAQDFDYHGPKRRVGIIGAMYLEPFSTGVVRPHEQTFAHHKKDRLELTTRVKTNLSPIFGLYSNASFSPEPEQGWDQPADIDVVQAGVRSRIWALTSPRIVEAVSEAVAGRTVFIADGHHRYETALNYFGVAHPERRLVEGDGGPSDEQEPAAHVMAFLGAFEDPGMIILPTHRELVSSGGADHNALVANLQTEFEVERIPKSAAGRDRLRAALDEVDAGINRFAVALNDQADYFLVEGRARTGGGSSPKASLDVTVLHDVILGRALSASGGANPDIAYSANADEVLDRVDGGSSDAAILMRPMLADQMAAVCMADELLPQKSTYFYPKLLTGLVFHSLGD